MGRPRLTDAPDDLVDALWVRASDELGPDLPEPGLFPSWVGALAFLAVALVLVALAVPYFT